MARILRYIQTVFSFIHTQVHIVVKDNIMPPKHLNFITGNGNKLAEVQAILGDAVQVASQSLDLTEIQGSIEEISRDKCRRAASIVRSEENW